MKDKTLNRVFGFFLVIFGVLAVVAVYAVRSLNRSVAGNDWVNHTHAVILEVEGVLAELQAGEGALRTYLLTGNSSDLAASRENFAIMTEHLELAKALTRNDPESQAQVLRLEALVGERTAFAQRAGEARGANQAATVQALLEADAGSAAVAEIRRQVGRLTDGQRALLAERDRTAYLQAQTTRWVVGSGVALNFVLFAAVAWLIRDDLAARRRLAVSLQEANAQLEDRVRERTAELAAANERLKMENLERRWSGQSLEHQLRYNQLIVDSVNDLVFVLTKALKITRINPAVIHLTGYELPALLSQPLSAVVQLSAEPGQPAGALDPVGQALRDGRDLQNRPAEVTDKHGRKIPARLTLFPLRDRDKVVGGVIILQARPTEPPA